ncbi:MAG: VOC family protein [Burkholderiaceae bacterium]
MIDDPDFATEGAFDHLVVMVRDRLDPIAADFTAAGYELGETTRHDIGSINRLVVLDAAYVELLGWPPGAPPPRPEIAERPIGMDALVFRSVDATATSRRLRAAGFDVTDAMPLRRPTRVAGRAVEARFATGRFKVQPLAGIRVYFCQHLTPEYVWTAAARAHPNGARELASISLAAADPDACAALIGAMLPSARRDPSTGNSIELPNLALRIDAAGAGSDGVRISAAEVRGADGRLASLPDARRGQS